MDNMIYRFSYTTLNFWSSGNYEDAVKSYLGERTIQTKEMYAGNSLHRLWESEIKLNNKMPTIFGGKAIHGEFYTELKKTKLLKINDQISVCFVGVFDLWEEESKNARDWKTGKAISGKQSLFYNYLEPRMKRFIYHLFNQNTQETSISIRHCNKDTFLAGQEWALSNSSEFISYLSANNIFNKDSHNKSIKLLYKA